MRYPILIVFDGVYSEYSIVLIYNIYIKSTNKENLFFHIITDHETDFGFQEKYLVSNEIHYSLYRLNVEEFSDFPTSGHITKGAYYLLYAMNIIDELGDFILYLDIDIYLNDDISKVFQYANHAYALNCINSSPGNYFGSGFFLINRSKARERFNIDVFRNVLLSNQAIKWHDQDLLNIVFKDDSIKIIPYEWDFAVQHYLVSSESFHKDGIYLSDAKSIHYPGTTKPWRYSTILPFAREWRELYFDIYGRNPWTRVSFKEFILRILYILFPNPSMLFEVHGFLRKLFLRK